MRNYRYRKQNKQHYKHYTTISSIIDTKTAIWIRKQAAARNITISRFVSDILTALANTYGSSREMDFDYLVTVMQNIKELEADLKILMNRDVDVNLPDDERDQQIKLKTAELNRLRQEVRNGKYDSMLRNIVSDETEITREFIRLKQEEAARINAAKSKETVMDTITDGHISELLESFDIVKLGGSLEDE